MTTPSNELVLQLIDSASINYESLWPSEWYRCNLGDLTKLIDIAMAEGEKQSENKCDALCDSSFLRGVQTGWNLGIMEDRDGLLRVEKSRDGYLKAIRNRGTK